MSLEKVKQYFHEFGLEDRVKVLSQSSATVEAAAVVSRHGLLRQCLFLLVMRLY